MEFIKRYTGVIPLSRMSRFEKLDIFGVLLAAVSIYLTGSALPVPLIAVPAIFCFYLALQNNSATPEPAEPEAREPAAA